MTVTKKESSANSPSNSEVVKEIARKTDLGDIEWSTFKIAEDQNTSRKTYVNPAYEANHKGRKLHLYQVRSKIEVPKNPLNVGSPVPDLKEEWKDETVLEVINPETDGRWQFPNDDIIQDLLEKVQRNTAGVDDWMKDVVNES